MVEMEYSFELRSGIGKRNTLSKEVHWQELVMKKVVRNPWE